MGDCTGASREHLLEPPLGLDFPWATGEILGRNTESGVRGRHPRWRQGNRRTREAGEKDRAQESKRGLSSERTHIFKGSPPRPASSCAQGSGEVVQDSGLEASFTRNLSELGKVSPCSEAEKEAGHSGLQCANRPRAKAAPLECPSCPPLHV